MNQPVTVAITQRVRPGYEAQYEEAMRELIVLSLELPGQLGVHVLRPVPNSTSREYGILRRFADAATRDAFYNSDLFLNWRRSVQEFVDGEPHYESVSGLEGWFALPGERAIIPPPRWKTALATLLGVYPSTVFWNWALAPLLGHWNPLLRSLVVVAAVVVSLTYFVMPQITRVLRPWLNKKS